MKKKSTYDTGFNMTIQNTHRLQNKTNWSAGEEGARYAIAWFNSLTLTDLPSQQIDVINCDEWDKWSPMFTEFAIQGFKMQYQPYDMNGRTISQGVASIGTYDSPLLLLGTH